jgi:branched-chain amino acid transport system permease protein
MALDSSLAVLVAPFADMVSSPIFFAEVVVGGLMAGVMYAMVALGFVLIFKASGVFNFAQGVMVLFAALTLVGLMEHGLPVWLNSSGAAMSKSSTSGSQKLLWT